MNPALIRAPIDQPFTVDPATGLIIDQAWLAWFTRQMTPAVNDLIGKRDPPDVPLEVGKDYPRQSDGSGVTLPLPSRQLAWPTGEFPPRGMRGGEAPPWPPPSPRGQTGSDLALLAASQPSRSLPIWVIADTAANITKYPPSAYPVNALYIATDTDVLYRNSGTAWGSILPGQVITTPTVTLEVGGSATGITQTSACSCIQTGKNVLLLISVTLSAAGSGSGAVTLALGTIPTVAKAGSAIVSNLANMLLLTSSVDAYLAASSTTIALEQTGATGSSALAYGNLSNTSSFNLALAYQSS